MRIDFFRGRQGVFSPEVVGLWFFWTSRSCRCPLSGWSRDVRWVDGGWIFHVRGSETGPSCVIGRLRRVGGTSLGVTVSGMCRVCGRCKWDSGQGRFLLAPERFAAILQLYQQVVSAGDDPFLPPQRVVGASIYLAIGLPECGKVVCSCRRLLLQVFVGHGNQLVEGV